MQLAAAGSYSAGSGDATGTNGGTNGVSSFFDHYMNEKSISTNYPN
jgi:hypothetical protein